MTSRHYSNVGKILYAEHPELAEQLSRQLDERKAQFTDLSLLPEILNTFCQAKEITVDQLTGKENGLSQKTMNKHVFIAIIVRLYSPATLGPTKELLISRLREHLSRLLITRGDRISRIISNIRIYLTAYKDFLREVEEYYQLIINTHGIKESNQGSANQE